jgi:hypothetical protein
MLQFQVKKRGKDNSSNKKNFRNINDIITIFLI